jgi:transketolase
MYRDWSFLVSLPHSSHARTVELRGGVDVPRLTELARSARVDVLRTVAAAGSGHLGGSLSVVDLLVVLYFYELRVDPRRPGWPDRDRFVFSKGHAAAALYSIMASRGYFPPSELSTFDAMGSRLQMHPDMNLLPGLDMSTGSLGQGLSAALGMALGGRLQGRSFRTYVVLGDGESQEGQVWEAAAVAARYGLDNLVALLDWNGLQQYGWVQSAQDPTTRMDPIVDPAGKFRAFGWHVSEIDGNDIGQIVGALDQARSAAGRPTVIVARTVKGRGVSFMESNYRWHASPISPEQLEAALKELDG